MKLEYLDFDLQIAEGEGRDYPVQVLRSPAGEAHGIMRFPFDELALENRLLTLQNALLRSGGTRRAALSAEQRNVQGFGQALFEALITGEVRSRYEVSLERARQTGKGLRVRLRFQSAALAALPWEFLYDARQAEFVGLTVTTPIVRYLDLPRSAQTLDVTPPLRILGVTASPSDLPQLHVENERQRLEVAVKELQDAGRIELNWLTGATWRDLQRTLRRAPCHILHFIGHGGFEATSNEGLIYLANEEGKAHPLRATELGRLLADHASMRLVVLNACESAKGSERDIFSSTASILVRRGLPAVVAMQYEITDRAAIELSRAFYEALVDGLPVDAAVASARVSVSLAVNNTVEWGTPVLYMRAPDGILFEMAAPPAASGPIPKGAALPAAEAQATAAQRARPAVAPNHNGPPAAAGVKTDQPSRARRSWLILLALAGIVMAAVALLTLWPDAPGPPPAATTALQARTSGAALAVARDDPTEAVTATAAAVSTGMPTTTAATASPRPPTATATRRPAATSTPTSAPPSRPRVAVDSSNAVNVRSGPSTVYPVVGQVNPGSSLEVTGRNTTGDWWQVCCVAGQTGWISAALVTPPQGDQRDILVAASPPTPLPTATALPRPTATAVSQVAVAVRVERSAAGDAEVFVDYSDGTSRNVTNHPSGDAYATLTPDRQRIVFSSTRNGPANIYVMYADGSGATRLAEGNLPALSPDGQRIAYQKITPVGFRPQWTADGGRVIFERLDGAYIVNADGTGEERYAP